MYNFSLFLFSYETNCVYLLKRKKVHNILSYFCCLFVFLIVFLKNFVDQYDFLLILSVSYLDRLVIYIKNNIIIRNCCSWVYYLLFILVKKKRIERIIQCFLMKSSSRNWNRENFIYLPMNMEFLLLPTYIMIHRL